MTALLEPPVLGVQEPRLITVPAGIVSSLGAHAVQWTRDVLGINLHPFQQFKLDLMLSQRADGKWAASQVVDIMSRQNSKSLLLMIRELYGIIVLGEKEALHSAHSGDTVRVAYQATVAFLEAAPGRIPRQEYGAIGRERIDFTEAGGTLWFKTRTRSGGRGYTVDGPLVLDEAQELTDEQMQALTPTLAARSMIGNPQLFYAGSAGDYQSAVLARMRRNGIDGATPRMLFLEYSIDDEAFMAADPDARLVMLADPVQRAKANPLYGLMISDEFLDDALGRLGAIGFAKEHMCVGSWPIDDSTDWLIPRARWAALADPNSAPPAGAVALAIGAAWDRTVSIGVCGARADGRVLAELTHYGAGPVVKIVQEVIRLREAHLPVTIVVDDKGPVDFLIAPLEAAGVVLERISVRDVAAATSGLHAAVTESDSGFRHRGQAEVSAALAGARKKDVGDGWVLDRRRSAADVTPLEVLALARWGFVKFGRATYDVMNSAW